MKAYRKLMLAVFLAAMVVSSFSVSVFAVSPQISNVSVSSLVSGKNVIMVNNYSNKFVTNASTVRVSFQIQDPNGTVASGRVQFFGEQSMSQIAIVPDGSNQFHIDWAIPDMTIDTKDCRLVIYCTDVATGLEDRVDQYIDIKYSNARVIAEPINTYVSDFSGGSFYVQSTIYDLSLSGVTDVSFNFVKVGVPYTQYNSASISNMGNNTYYCGATLNTSNWSDSDGEYRVSMSAVTVNPSGTARIGVIRSVYINTPNTVPSLYQNSNFTGNKAYVEDAFYGWETGNYTTADLAAKNIGANDISSIIVPPGYRVIVYDSDYFMGDSYAFDAGSYNISYYLWDNRIDSLKVVKI